MNNQRARASEEVSHRGRFDAFDGVLQRGVHFRLARSKDGRGEQSRNIELQLRGAIAPRDERVVSERHAGPYDYYGATSDFLLKQIKNLSSGWPLAIISQFDYTYRQDRQIDTWAINQGSGTNTWTFAYDDARQLTGATLRDASLDVLETHDYGYDPAGPVVCL